MFNEKMTMKDFVVEVMVKPLPKVLAKCALTYEATIVGMLGLAWLIVKTSEKFGKKA